MKGQSTRSGAWAWQPFVMMTIVMAVKSLIAWQAIFGPEAGMRPLITDLATLWLLLAILELAFVRGKAIWYLIINLMLTTIYFSAIMYYHYYGVIVTYHALGQINQVTAVKDSVFSLLHPEYLLLYTDIILIGGGLFASRRLRAWRRSTSRQLPALPTAAAALMLAAICGGQIAWNRQQINELVQARGMGLLNYQIYHIALDRPPPLIPAEEITPSAIKQLKGTVEASSPQLRGQAHGSHVILIQLEAFQSLLLNQEINGQAITPVMNGLAAQSLFFPHFYQQVGQGNTSDAEFVVNTSLFIPPIGAATDVYGGKQLPGLPRMLREEGYYAATFHTNDVAFWNRDRLYGALGFDAFYDQAFFGEQDKIAFGASDEVLYRRTAQELVQQSRQDQRVYAHIISMSAHHPFRLPEDKRQLQLPSNFVDTLVGDYLTAQHYADYALGQFIEELKRSGLWEKSLVAVYGDHLGLPMYALGEEELDLLHTLLGRPYTYPDMLNIPLVLSLPGQSEPRQLEQVGGQVDILPTIANLLGLDVGREIYFGQDLLNGQHNLLPQRYYLPSGSFVTDTGVFIPGGGFADGTLYPINSQEQRTLGGTSPVSEQSYEHALRLLRLSDSYTRQLPDTKISQ
ncbi:LTA synthase family protein [Paenibacillus daejeonensis]|uniref:LTA synthase family protein n=1 Tax=Paenibacillus daejeonensis TaxID=135193 RepID=UPI0003682874|nr:LTA synthase family protein [Paenibacillus daejeonensis]